MYNTVDLSRLPSVSQVRAKLSTMTVAERGEYIARIHAGTGSADANMRAASVELYDRTRQALVELSLEEARIMQAKESGKAPDPAPAVHTVYVERKSIDPAAVQMLLALMIVIAAACTVAYAIKVFMENGGIKVIFWAVGCAAVVLLIRALYQSWLHRPRNESVQTEKEPELYMEQIQRIYR